MGRFPPCPPPCNPDGDKDKEYSGDQSLITTHNILHSSEYHSSSSNSSLTSQLSLPSVPSLTPHPQTLEHATSSSTTAAAVHHRCIATLKGHSSYIFSLSVAGKHLYSGASNGEIRVWDRSPSSSSTHSYNTVTEGHSAVKSMVVLGEKLITAHQDHKIRIWKLDSRKYKLITVLPTVTDRCMTLFSAKSYVEVRRHKKRTWVHHVDAVSSLALSKNGSLLYSVSWDRTIKVWRTSDFKCVESVQNAHDDAINAVVLSSDDGGHAYTCSSDRTIKVWRKEEEGDKHSLVSTLEKHKSAVNALALSCDGSVLYSGACDRSIIVWGKGGGAAGWAVEGALRGHKKAVLCLGVVSDLVCSGSADKTVRVWRRGCGNSYSCLAVFEGHNSPVKCLTASLDHNNNYCRNKNNNNSNCDGNSYLVYSGGLDFDIKVWQIRVY